jgi:murein DD-endopeptidase MepM/ murein hydrolase activator NlpD
MGSKASCTAVFTGRRGRRAALSVGLAVAITLFVGFGEAWAAEFPAPWVAPQAMSTQTGSQYHRYYPGMFEDDRWAVDFTDGCRRGIPVVAPFNGTIVRARSTARGNQVIVSADAVRLYVGVAHLNTLAVSEQQRVSQGQLLGTVGNTGNTAGSCPHIHMAAWSGTGDGAGMPITRLSGQAVYGGARITGQTPPAPSVVPRMAVINGQDALFVKEGDPFQAWVRELAAGDARAVAMSGNRIYAINGCGASYLKDGPLNAAWVLETGCGDSRAIAVTQNRLAVINGCGALYTKEGPANAPWVRQLDCGDARAVALAGNRIYAINGCGASYLKDGPLNAAWVQETGCGDSRAIAVTQNRLAVINGCGALYTKEGPANAAWVKQLECGDARAVAMGGNRIYAINGCEASYLKDGPLNAAWVLETGCGDSRDIAVTQNRLAVINGCGALYTKDGPANAAWVRQVTCEDARKVALAN